MDRFEQLEAKINKQRKTNRMLALALLVSFSLSASNYEWVKTAWAATAMMMDLTNQASSMTSLTSNLPGLPGFYSYNQANSTSSSAILGQGYMSTTGVKGTTATGNGIFGSATSSTAGNGVYGSSVGTTGYGVYGYQNGSSSSSSAAGVYGSSNNSYGIKGHSSLVQGGSFTTSGGKGQINLTPSFNSSRDNICTPGDLRAEKSGDNPPYNYYLLFCGTDNEWKTIATDIPNNMEVPTSLTEEVGAGCGPQYDNLVVDSHANLLFCSRNTLVWEKISMGH